MTQCTSEPAEYRLAKKSNFWISFTAANHHGSPTYQLQVSARNRGGAKSLAILLESTALRPLATISLKGESYPLTIGWHEAKRGGVLCFGGERKTGQDGGVISWEMQWRPVAGEADCFAVEMRVRSTPRREGHLSLDLNVPLYQPEVSSLPAAAVRGHCAQTARSAYSGQAIGFVMLTGAEDDACWDENRGGFATTLPSFSLGGGKVIRFSLRFTAAKSDAEAKAALAAQYASLADALLHPCEAVLSLNPTAAIEQLTRPDSYEVRGAVRLYLKPQAVEAEADTCYAGYPHYPLDALKALCDWQRFHACDEISKLVRFGAYGVSVDFQVMGREGHGEPNKGAFWDKVSGGVYSDFSGEQTHGIESNARIAGALFQLHQATGEPLFKQSAVNICQWLILKQNSEGYFDGERVHATRGLRDDGKFIPQPCSLHGLEAIRPFSLAFEATGNEVYIKAAWKIVNYFLEVWRRDWTTASPVAVSRAILALLTLERQASNEKLRAVIRDWGAWLRVLPVSSEAVGLNADGLYSGLYECAQAGFYLHAFEPDSVYLRYAFSALAAIPHHSKLVSWRAVTAHFTALLSLACILPDTQVNLETLTLRCRRRDYAPDPATERFIQIAAADGSGPVDFLPLVCPENDQLFLIVLAPPTVNAVTILKNGRPPIVRDLLTGNLEETAALHSLVGEKWAHVGLFTIDR